MKPCCCKMYKRFSTASLSRIWNFGGNQLSHVCKTNLIKTYIYTTAFCHLGECSSGPANAVIFELTDSERSNPPGFQIVHPELLTGTEIEFEL